MESPWKLLRVFDAWRTVWFPRIPSAWTPALGRRWSPAGLPAGNVALYTQVMLHKVHDAVGLALARRIAEGVGAHPEWVELAKANLDRWSRLNGDAPALLACYQEWRGILDRPIEEIRDVLLDPTDLGQRLRQNSPFAGVLTAAEVWHIKRQVHETTTA